MTYPEALNYLLERLPMFQRVGAAAYRADLKNIIRLCDVVGNPQKSLRCVHIAGTNGKGSVTHIIASVLQSAGYKTGIYASPHYKDYRERIKINGALIQQEFVTDFVSTYYSDFSKIDASFFEITTAMMFAYFHEMKTDCCVVETGMGGRLDSTNIIAPLLSVITNISFDHQQFLGDTLAKIAAEKAGIIKPGVPVIVGELHPETKNVFTAFAEKNSSAIQFAEEVIQLENFQTGFEGSKFNVIRNGALLYEGVNSDVGGSYQKKNLTTAIAAIQEFNALGITTTTNHILEGLANVKLKTNFIGRWMVMQRNPIVIFDSAHNEGGLRELLAHLPAHRQLHIVYGTVADKDLKPIFEFLPKHASYYFCKANIPRAKAERALAAEALLFELKGETFSDVTSALQAALLNADANDLVLLTGSVFVVAEAL